MKIIERLKAAWRDIPKKSLNEIQTKSFPMGLFSDYLETYGHSDLAAHTTLNLFSNTAPLNNAADILAAEFSSLTPQVVDISKDDEVVVGHPVLELLKNPNADSTCNEFLYSLALFYVATGNSYVVATGDVKKDPLEIMSSFPQQITIQADSRDGYAGLISDNRTTSSIDFKRDEQGGRFRFYNHDVGEIWQIKRFNPNPNSLVGQSQVSPIFPEIDQYNHASIHNSSLLKRGGRPSGILMMNSVIGKNGDVIPPLTKEQEERLREQINNYVAGSKNAGKVLAIAGANIKWENLITSNRDMDFAELKKDVSNKIYNQYKIPLPFVNPERQTFANMGVSKEQLYDNAVLPLADRLFNELNIFLMPRSGRGSENYKLTYDVSEIPALKERKVREVKTLGETELFTDNELRALLGREPYLGGDVIYKSSNKVAVGKDAYTGDEPPVPKTTKKKFTEIMKTKGYADEKIEVMAVALNLK
jgi:HK97 family phage portal protein